MKDFHGYLQMKEIRIDRKVISSDMRMIANHRALVSVGLYLRLFIKSLLLDSGRVKLAILNEFYT